jgi:hypothetical protein
MGIAVRREKPLQVRLFCGLIGSTDHFARARERLESEFGPVDCESPTEPFTFTDYYAAEMGPSLSRKWIAFASLKERAYLARAKHIAVWIEECLTRGGRRTVNIDPGYVDNAQIVLSTTKNFAHRVYIGMGYYAEVTLVYVNGAFRPFEWTYPDYTSQTALEFFGTVRSSYYDEMRRRGET